jgi:hypothetical protein
MRPSSSVTQKQHSVAYCQRIHFFIHSSIYSFIHSQPPETFALRTNFGSHPIPDYGMVIASAAPSCLVLAPAQCALHIT